ncbi:transporter substrate-binding domain-containing protein [Bifidobacterium sp.]|jgi:glutamate transport system substrate-binding protein|uniref:transporter substrate-binding domain-containing protein n=1 Tax=Bifidobacterium sp. TaxID=41200 RepID=UPI0025C701FD|nr:transporter substrate-binding domain-containing protein [Bifidobacterium sp.]MCH4209840.1 transporter substrate-binding domain-containing protein [Bifidobacterium sp.]MCI1224161.1 transporter substrate-binding domain-containing protein [Bifidobacterium sp.]
MAHNDLQRLTQSLRAALALVLSMALGLSMAACGQNAAMAGAPDGPTITIGVAFDEPGVGLRHDGQDSGFDITVARYVAQVLGYARKQVNFTQIWPSNADSTLRSGKAQMLVTSLPMDSAKRKGVQSSKPYLLTRQDLLIRQDDRTSITGFADLNGKVVCSAQGSGATQNLKTKIPGVIVHERNSYPQCVTALLIGEADAVSADDAVLSGLASAMGKDYLALVGDPLGQAAHAVQVSSGENELIGKINDALAMMRRDGSLVKALDALRGGTGYAKGVLPGNRR